MPKKLMDCVKKVMESGKDESSAWAICTKSTGLKRHKEQCSTFINLVVFANQLDTMGFYKEASDIDESLLEYWEKKMREDQVQRYKEEQSEKSKKEWEERYEEYKAQEKQKEWEKEWEEQYRKKRAPVSQIPEVLTSEEFAKQFDMALPEVQEKIVQLLQKTEKKGGWWSMFTKAQITDLVAMADRLDATGLHEEAGEIDALLKEAGIGDWLKGVWQAIKGNPQAHDKYVQIFNGMKKATTNIRKAFSGAEQTLKNLERFVTKPDLANLKRWSDVASQLDDQIQITLKEAKNVAAAHQAFENFSQTLFQEGGGAGQIDQPTTPGGTPGKPGAGGMTQRDLVDLYKMAPEEFMKLRDQIMTKKKAPKTPDLEDTQLIEPIKPGEAI